MPKLNGNIIKKELVAEQTYLIGIEINQFLDPRPGSFYSFKVAEKTFRSYSLVFADNKIDKDRPEFTKNYIVINDNSTNIYFLIATKGEGPGANYFKNIKIDDEVTMVGPAGKFGLSGDLNKNKIFVGTGTGLAPFIGMSHRLIDQEFKQSNLTILAGLKGSDGSWIKNILPKGINLMTCFFPHKENLSDNEANETVTDRVKILIDEGKAIEGTEFYLCGHPRMVADVEELILNSGKEYVIFKEKFSI